MQQLTAKVHELVCTEVDQTQKKEQNIARNGLWSSGHPYVCIVQALVITNYKLTSIHEYCCFWHICKNITYPRKLTV